VHGSQCIAHALLSTQTPNKVPNGRLHRKCLHSYAIQISIQKSKNPKQPAKAVLEKPLTGWNCYHTFQFTPDKRTIISEKLATIIKLTFP